METATNTINQNNCGLESEQLKTQMCASCEIRNNFNYFFDNVTDYIYIKDANHRFVAASRSFAQAINHKSRHDIKGKTDFDIFPEANAKTHAKHERKILQGAKSITELEEPYHDSDGNICWFSTRKEPVYDSKKNIVGLIGISRDITKYKKLEKELKQKANYDDLTGIASRNYFFEESELILRLAARMEYKLGLFFIDLNKFKFTNDTYGHEAGDAVLCATAERLNNISRSTDIIGRFGGDEFVMLTTVKAKQDLDKIAARVLKEACIPITFKGKEISIECSIGIAFSDMQTENIDELIAKADIAMYKAKAEKKASYQIF